MSQKLYGTKFVVAIMINIVVNDKISTNVMDMNAMAIQDLLVLIFKNCSKHYDCTSIHYLLIK
jgi:hypothetical protein